MNTRKEYRVLGILDTDSYNETKYPDKTILEKISDTMKRMMSRFRRILPAEHDSKEDKFYKIWFNCQLILLALGVIVPLYVKTQLWEWQGECYTTNFTSGTLSDDQVQLLLLTRGKPLVHYDFKYHEVYKEWVQDNFRTFWDDIQNCNELCDLFYGPVYLWGITLILVLYCIFSRDQQNTLNSTQSTKTKEMSTKNLKSKEESENAKTAYFWEKKNMLYTTLHRWESRIEIFLNNNPVVKTTMKVIEYALSIILDSAVVILGIVRIIAAMICLSILIFIIFWMLMTCSMKWITLLPAKHSLKMASHADMIKQLQTGYHENNTLIQYAWDTFQVRHRCCGVDGPLDFLNTTWASSFLDSRIPKSCCVNHSVEGIRAGKEDSANLIKNEKKSADFFHHIHTEGCYLSLKQANSTYTEKLYKHINLSLFLNGLIMSVSHVLWITPAVMIPLTLIVIPIYLC